MMTDNLRGVSILTLAMLFFAVEDAFIKFLTGNLPVSQVLGMLALAGAIYFGTRLRFVGLPFWSRDLLHPAVMIRNGAEAVASAAIVMALALTDLSATSAIMQSVPLFITIGAMFWLREPVAWRRSAAVACGFAGVLLVLRPGFDGFDPALIWAMVAAAGLAVRDLVTRRVPAQVPSHQLSASAFMALLIAAGILALVLGERPEMPDASLALASAVCIICTLIGYGLLVSATRIADASVLAPVRYARLVFAMFIAVIVFGEHLDLPTIAGTVIIVLSGAYTIWREAQLGRPRAVATMPAGTLPVTPEDPTDDIPSDTPLGSRAAGPTS
ncbi:EamA-like transporter family protein (plasmid) [Sulfitobacter sp. THAF37]|uniref:DMT family transporter n=1 Tax=Sulfitobacter sp. THAF37 TaxID=2587855 RepID=UPI00126937B0|nr:DMT family transporter [Sulfitobacter sp. THAF37]QFT60769.1 EamA-like transporter family protein [Sulfitobacter sp. THAF37]